MGDPGNHLLRDTVAAQLDALSRPGGVLHTSGPRSTASIYRDSASRVELRAEIIERYKALQPDVRADGYAAVVMAGPPAAGKSTVRARRSFDGWRILDADLAKKILIERALRDGIFDDLLSMELADGRALMPAELAPLVHSESSEIVDALREECVRDGENVIIDGTLTWRPERGPGIGVMILRELAEEDYQEVDLIDVEVPESSALERSVNRWWAGRTAGGRDGFGGRYVPASAISSVYLPDGSTKSRMNADEAFRSSVASEIRHLTLSEFGENASMVRHLVKVKGRAIELPSTALTARDRANAWPQGGHDSSTAPPTTLAGSRVWIRTHSRGGRRVEGYWRGRPGA